jgi:predicted alpha/beta-fold hydrolase
LIAEAPRESDAPAVTPARDASPGAAGSAYAAPRWLPGGHLQTLYAALAAPRPPVAYRRTRWDTPDGDFIDVDFIDSGEIAVDGNPSQRTEGNPGFPPLPPVPAGEGSRPLVALFHGLEGCSASHYAHALMSHVHAAGWRGCVVHFRGCAGEANRLARAYHSGDSAEIDWILPRLRAASRSPVYAVGVSLGGNVLLKWLGERGEAAEQVVSGAAAVSAPVDLAAAGDALGRGFNLVYTTAFLRTLKRKSLAKLSLHPALYDAGRVRRARTLRAFDDVVTAPLHGFRDADDYWRRSSSRPLLGRIRVPTLMINARNDPFLPESALPSASEVSAHVTLEFPRTGGHVGFVSGFFPGNLDWLPRRIMKHFGHPAC